MATTAFLPQPTTLPSPIPPPRTNAALNLSVLRRHNPQIIDILSLAPYAVIYTFNPTLQTWEKSGTEGTLFVCRLASTTSPAQHYGIQGAQGIERYSVIVLNRRGMDNFELELTSEEDVEITPEYVILQAEKKHEGDGEEVGGDEEGESTDTPIVYGLWIFQEVAPGSTSQMREVNAGLIQDCAIRADASRKAAADMVQWWQESGGEYNQAGWEHQPSQIMNSGGERNSGGADVLGNLFRRAKQGYSSTGL